MNRKCESALNSKRKREREREQIKFINETLNAKTNGKSNEHFLLGDSIRTEHVYMCCLCNCTKDGEIGKNRKIARKKINKLEKNKHQQLQ